MSQIKSFLSLRSHVKILMQSNCTSIITPDGKLWNFYSSSPHKGILDKIAANKVDLNFSEKEIDFIAKLQHENIFTINIDVDGVVVAVIEPSKDFLAIIKENKKQPKKLALSRFAYIRAEGEEVILEASDGQMKLRLRDSKLVSELAKLFFHSTDQLKPTALTRKFHSLLFRTGFLKSPMEESVSKTYWEFHDLLFHKLTRMSSHELIGGTYRFKEKYAPENFLRKTKAKKIPLNLPVPTVKNSKSFSEVLNNRKSSLTFPDTSISAARLSEFLHGVAKVKSIIKGELEEIVKRPFPSSGAISEIEFYVLCKRCDGIDQGLYRYNGYDHSLEQISPSNEKTHGIYKNAVSALPIKSSPSILIILSTRYPRLAWKYETITYRLSLLNAGTILQTMYLKASEMGLACSAIGWCDSNLFSEAVSTEVFSETSIAEFALGESNKSE